MNEGVDPTLQASSPMPSAHSPAAVTGRRRESLRLLDGKLAEHLKYIRAHGDDMPEVRHWRWPD